MIKVSIIITSYNYEKYIERCIASCLQQKDFSDFEVIVVDDGSIDNTKLILEEYSGKINFYLNNNQGIELASNFGISKAKGEYIVRVDADDMLKEDYLINVYEQIKNSQADFVYSEYFLIDSNDEIIAQKKLPQFNVKEIRLRGDFLATGTLYKKSILNQVGLYNDKTKNSGLENYELILKLLSNNYKGFCINKPLFYYRRHSENVSIKRKSFIIKYGQKLSKKFKLSDYNTNENHPWGLKL